MFGSLRTAAGATFTLQRCRQGHVWAELDTGSLPDDRMEQLPDGLVTQDGPCNTQTDSNTQTDNITLATYSVMFYYTPEFAANTTDIQGYIDQVATLPLRPSFPLFTQPPRARCSLRRTRATSRAASRSP